MLDANDVARRHACMKGALDDAAESLQADKELVLVAVSTHGNALACVLFNFEKDGIHFC